MWRVYSLDKDPDDGRDCGQEKGMTEDEMAGWHHQLDGHEFELEGLMLKLKLQYFGHPQRPDSFEKTLMLGKIEGRWRREWQRMVGWHHRLVGCGFGWTPGVGVGQGGLACCSSWGCKELDTTEWLNWTESSHRTFTKTGCILDDKTHVGKLKRIKIIQCVLSDHSGIKLVISNRRAAGKPQTSK